MGPDFALTPEGVAVVPLPLFDEVGCYADSRHGVWHVRHQLARLLEAAVQAGLVEAGEAQPTVEALFREPTDDCAEMDEGLEMLNQKAVADGLRFEWSDGDLVLMEVTDDEA